MINFFDLLKASKLKAVSYKLNKGMSYVELIVVLTIFSVLSTVVIYSYNEFQAKVDIKNLASDIALKIVEAQRASLSGNLPPGSNDPSWKPAYGIHFNAAKSFIYFVDRSGDGAYNSVEALDTISITTPNSITGTYLCNASCPSSSSNPLSISFQRPNSGARFADSSGTLITTGFEYIKIEIVSDRYSSMRASISVYPSGRIQVD